MKTLLLRLGFCLALFGFCLYSYLDVQSALTHLKIQLADGEKELRLVREENRRMAYEIDQFENPSHLIELAHRPEFRHLKHPLLREVMTLSEPSAFASSDLP